MPLRINVLWGIIVGLIGGAAGAFILWGAWLLPALGLLLTRVSLVNGGLAMIILGVLGGALYSLIMRKFKLNLFFTVLSGVFLGFIFWILGVLIVVPLILGFPPLITSPQDHLVSLLAFILYGLIVQIWVTMTAVSGRLKTRLIGWLNWKKAHGTDGLIMQV